MKHKNSHKDVIKIEKETKLLQYEGFLIQDYFMNTAYETIIFDNNGYKTDLLAIFCDLLLNYDNNFTIRYYISSEKKTKEDIMMEYMKRVMGIVSVDLYEQAYSYSEYTSGLDYILNMKIGGHNILRELKDNTGKFCILEIEVEK